MQSGFPLSRLEQQLLTTVWSVCIVLVFPREINLCRRKYKPLTSWWEVGLCFKTQKGGKKRGETKALIEVICLYINSLKIMLNYFFLKILF